MKRGFTLVELSIVLVIIGLLIGGVLVAQSMTDTAKVERTVRDFQQFQIMANQFKDVYKYYPGDLPNAFATFDGNGTGNGTICGGDWWNNGVPFQTQGCDGDGNGVLNSEEMDIFWLHLSLAHIYPANFSDMDLDGKFMPGKNVPAAQFTNNLYSAQNGLYIPDGTLVPYAIAIIIINPADRTDVSQPGVTYEQMVAIDTKMDDGNPLTGKVFDLRFGWGPPTCVRGGAWRGSMGVAQCTPYFTPDIVY